MRRGNGPQTTSGLSPCPKGEQDSRVRPLNWIPTTSGLIRQDDDGGGQNAEESLQPDVAECIVGPRETWRSEHTILPAVFAVRGAEGDSVELYFLSEPKRSGRIRLSPSPELAVEVLKLRVLKVHVLLQAHLSAQRFFLLHKSGCVRLSRSPVKFAPRKLSRALPNAQ